jgi:TRAP-type C4-dicarboxylate transport system permease small subunit
VTEAGDRRLEPSGRRLALLARGGRLVGDLLRLIAAVLLFAMMAVTFVDVVGRYLFSRPLTGAFELTEVLLGLIVFAGLPIVTWRREHVTVDLVAMRLPAPSRSLLARVAAVVTALVLAVLAWRLGVTASDLLAYGDASVFLGIPMGPVAAVMSALCAAAAAGALIRALRP